MTVLGVIGKIFAIFTRSKLVQAVVHEVFYYWLRHLQVYQNNIKNGSTREI